MCLLVARLGELPFLAANRDEVYARPFSAPRLWVAPTPFWAPRDEEEGGTWLGVNAEGLCAAITNRSLLPAQKGLASRGHLVTGALATRDPEEARTWLGQELARAPRNPCQILVFKDARGFFCRVSAEGVEFRDLAEGFLVLSNLHEPGEIDLDLQPDADFAALRPLLADPSPRLPGGYAICKRGSSWRGTVSSAFIEPGRRFLFAGGPPDEFEYEAVAGYPSS